MITKRVEPRSFGISATIVAVVTMITSATVATSTAASAAISAPPFCSGTAPILASQITSPVNLNVCKIAGRKVYINFPGGKAGIGLHVPAKGQGVTNVTLTTAGEYVLTAFNNNNSLTVKNSVPPTVKTSVQVPARASRPQAALADPACSEGDYNLEAARYLRGAATVNWYYNEDTASRGGQSGPSSLAAIRQGNVNMTTGLNNCGFAENAFAAQGAYQGTTGLYADIDSSTSCTSKFPDGQNTVSWGPFDSAHYDQTTHTGTLATTCIHWHDVLQAGAVLDEGDIYLGSNVSLVTVLPLACGYQQDLQTAVTHEWGHVFGLAHATSGADQVMYYARPWCTVRDHLGEGDYNGMASMYG